MENDENMEESCSEIIKGLWVGSEGAASSKQFFEKEDIKACLNCTPSIQNNFSFAGVEYLRLPLNDSPEKEDVSPYEGIITSGCRMATCSSSVTRLQYLDPLYMGIARSASVTCAYLMKHWGMSFKDAADFLILRRQPIFYNGDYGTFKNVLQEWEKLC